jgi:hypothetical protein
LFNILINQGPRRRLRMSAVAPAKAVRTVMKRKTLKKEMWL